MYESIIVGTGGDAIVPGDKGVFRDAMLISIGIGGLSPLVFHLVVKATDKTPRKVCMIWISLRKFNSFTKKRFSFR